jgi:Rrf2 family protein
MSGSSRFAVAVHILTVLGYLEQKGVKLVSSSQIAVSVSTNPVVIRTLLRTLKKAGLVISKEGKGGGVRLAKPSSRISLLDIFAAVEGDALFAANDKPSFQPCPVSRNMKKIFSSVTDEIGGAVAQVLRGRTLKQLVERI